MHERKLHPGLGHRPPGVLELASRVVQARDVSASLCRAIDHWARAAAELEHVAAGDLAKHVQLGLRQLPPPGQPARGRQLAAVARLTFVGSTSQALRLAAACEGSARSAPVISSPAAIAGQSRSELARG